MGRKSKERIIFEWLESVQARVGMDAFNQMMGVLKEDYPKVMKTRKAGRPPATDDPGMIIDGGLMNELEDFSALTDIFNMFGNRGKDLARLAVCLMEIGFFKSVNSKKKHFKETDKAIYNLICKYKEFSQNTVTYQAFKNQLDAIKTEETSYPKDEREEDKRMMLDALEIVREQYEDYVQYMHTAGGWNDWIYDL